MSQLNRALTAIAVFGCLLASTFAQDQTPESESVVVEGVGKTEASAKKAAYKEAVAKVVGVLIDSSTLVKNDKIIEEELLEYSGGFVTKAEVISSKKDEEGLVRIKIKCQVEKAQVQKKLQDIKVIVVKVDGASVAAKEMSQEELRKNASQFINKAMRESQNVYTLILPKDFQQLNKTETDEFLIPVKLVIDPEKLKIWTKTWIPIFEKLSIKSESAQSQLRRIEDPLPYFEHGNDLRDAALLIKLNKKQFILLLVPQSISKSYDIRWTLFVVPCDITKLDQIKCRQNKDGLAIQSALNAKVTLRIKDKNNDDIYVSESRLFGSIGSRFYKEPIVGKFVNGLNIDYQTHLATHFMPDSSFLEFPVIPGSANNYFYYQRQKQYFKPDTFGCVFKAQISTSELAKIENLSANIVWGFFGDE